MGNQTKQEFNTDWYELWMKQSKQFFETAEHNLKDMFSKNAYPRPEEHMQQIQAWLDALQKNFQFMPLNEQQKTYEAYWKSMIKMCNDANNMLVENWIKRSQEENPIKNIRELYELWLNCCNEAYRNMMKSKSFPAAFGEYMNAALKFWKSAIPK